MVAYYTLAEELEAELVEELEAEVGGTWATSGTLYTTS
jgi:hypothetical protein